MADLPTNRRRNTTIESDDINAIAQAVNGKIDATSAADLYYEKWFLDGAISSRAEYFHGHSAVDITSGLLPPARMATGTPGAGMYPDPVSGWTTIPTGGAGAVVGDGITNITAITQAAYDLLPSPRPTTTLYVVVG